MRLAPLDRYSLSAKFYRVRRPFPICSALRIWACEKQVYSVDERRIAGKKRIQEVPCPATPVVRLSKAISGATGQSAVNTQMLQRANVPKIRLRVNSTLPVQPVYQRTKI
jgi:hypothetical protein